MTALESLAISKLTGLTTNPLATIVTRDYYFNVFDETIPPPENIVGVEYDATGQPSSYSDSLVHVIRVHSYRTVSGKKEYSAKYAVGYCQLSGLPESGIAWTWDAPSGGADGYIVLSGRTDNLYAPYGNRLPFQSWEETLTESYNDEFTVRDADDLGLDISDPIYNPVAVGPWTRELQLIKTDIFTILEDGFLTITSDWLVSGPWCVAVGDRLVTNYGTGGAAFVGTNTDSIPHYKDVKFYYATDDHAGNVDVLTTCFFKEERICPTTTETYSCTLASSATVHLTAIIECSSGTGTWSHAVIVISGVITVVSETWTEVSNGRLRLDAEIALPSGASSLSIDASTTAGDITYWCIWADLEFATTTLTPSVVDGVHPSSTVSMVDYGAISTAGFVSSFWAAGNLALRAKGINGVWSAKTLPVFAEYTFLENSLPNYHEANSVYDLSGDDDSGVAGPRGSCLSDETFSVTPAVANRQSLWPVFRDTDFLTWKSIDLTGATKPVPFYSNGNHFRSDVASVAAGGYELVSGFIVGNEEFIRISYESSTLIDMYYSSFTDADPSNPATYDGIISTGTLKLPEDFSIPAGYTVAFKSADGSAFSFRHRTSKFFDYDHANDGIEPRFFRIRDDLDEYGTPCGATEHLSYNYTRGTKPDEQTEPHQHEIPQSGYCIFRLTVSRSPVLGVIPTIGEASLGVDVGIMVGCDIDNAGTFTSLETVTILADEGEASVDVFWPVVKGVALAYQSTDEVDVKAFVNFMPGVITNFDQDSTLNCGYNFGTLLGYFSTAKGRFKGKPCFEQDMVMRFENNTFYNWPKGSNLMSWVTFPASATIYNDLEALLNEL